MKKGLLKKFESWLRGTKQKNFFRTIAEIIYGKNFGKLWFATNKAGLGF